MMNNDDGPPRSIRSPPPPQEIRQTTPHQHTNIPKTEQKQKSIKEGKHAVRGHGRTSSMRSHSPSLTSSGWSNVEAISPPGGVFGVFWCVYVCVYININIKTQTHSIPPTHTHPPVTAASRSTPSKSACSIETRPASVKSCFFVCGLIGCGCGGGWGDGGKAT